MKKKILDAQKLRDLMNDKKVDKVPEGFQTAKEIGEQWDLGEARTSSLLREGVQAGILEKKHFRIKAGTMLRSVSHYREVKGNG